MTLATVPGRATRTWGAPVPDVPAVFEVANARRFNPRGAFLPDRDRPASDFTILDITKWFGETSGGVKTYLCEKARYVAAHPSLRQVLVIPGPFDSVALGHGVRVYRLQGPRIPTQDAYRFLFASRSTARIVRHELPSVIEIGSPFVVPWVAAHAARPVGVPLVSFHHMALGFGAGSGPRRRWGWGIAAAYARLVSRLVRLTIAASDFAVGELEAAGIHPVVRVPLGVDLLRFRPPSDEARWSARRRFGVPRSVPVGLFVGRLAPEKRLDLVLSAWPTIERETGAFLVIAGDGAHAASLRKANRARNVIWLPYQSDRATVAQLYSAADVYISPGDVETFGLAALEAMASGLPVLSSHLGGVAEMVSRSGAGRLFESGSPAEFIAAFRSLCDPATKSLGARARVYAETEHAWSAVFARLFSVYRSTVT